MDEKTKSLRKPSSPITDALAGNIRAYRQANNVSQEEFADVCGLHRTYIGSVERGERNVTLSTLEVFATVLKITVPELLTANRGSVRMQPSRVKRTK